MDSNSAVLPSWTIFPSLLTTLETDAHREALEAAVCAHHCGRFDDAASIFDSRLPESHTIPILTLERSDLLTVQGLEHERVELLRKALQHLPYENHGERTLTELLLADAELWAFGALREAFAKALGARRWLSGRSRDKLSDIEIRCALAYYQIIDICKTETNWVDDEAVIFPNLGRDLVAEIRAIRQNLKDQGRLTAAIRIALRELSFVTGTALKNLCDETLDLCQQMETSSHPALMYRCATTRLVISDQLKGLGLLEMSDDCFAKAMEIVEKVEWHSHQEWRTYTPRVNFDVQVRREKQSTSSEDEKRKNLFALAEDAIARKDFTKANQALIAAINSAKAWLQHIKQLDATVSVRSLQTYFLSFHREKTKLPYFEISALGDLFTILFIFFKAHEEILREYAQFEACHPGFYIPDRLENLLKQAWDAAKAIGRQDLVLKYEEKYRKVYMDCHFVDRRSKMGGLTEAAQVDPLFYFREIEGNSSDQVKRGDNAVKVILRWAKKELEDGSLTRANWESLFGFVKQSDESEASFESYLQDDSVANALFTSSHDLWTARFQKIQDWLLLPERPPFREARLYFLKVLAQSKTFRLRKIWADSGKVPDASAAQQLNDEESKLAEIKRLEAAEGAPTILTVDDTKSTNIYKTLILCSEPDAAKKELVNDDILKQTTQDCDDIIDQYKIRGNQIGEYCMNLQKSHLLSHRHWLFKTATLDPCLKPLEEAEDIFNDLRRNRSILHDPHSLVAKVKISDTFLHREHYNHALSLSACALGDPTTQYPAARAKGQEMDTLVQEDDRKYVEFLIWTQRSKGRGLADLLGLEARVPHELVDAYDKCRSSAEMIRKERILAESLEDKPLPERLRLREELDGLRREMRKDILLKPVMEIMDGTPVSEHAIHDMLQKLGSNIVLIDFVYLSHFDKLKAIVYRRGLTYFPVSIDGVSMKQIKTWADENLILGKEGKYKKPLSDDTQFNEKLQQLSKLLEPLVRVDPTVSSPDGGPYIQVGETVIFCPTDAIHLIPLHAIPVDGAPLIERNPVLYCQSLTILRHCFQTVQNWEKQESYKAIVVNPMPELWDAEPGDPVTSTEAVAALAKDLRATFHHGFNLKRDLVLESLANTNLLYYHGHVRFSKKSPMDSSLILDNAVYKKKPNGQTITANDLFNSKLAKPCLATIIGCRSGVVSVSSTNDLLGIPTALHYAGASAIVSTLWKVDDVDGAEWAKEFYGELRRQDKQNKGKTGVQGISAQLDLARAMQLAVLKLRDSRSKERAPYHWAGFVLHGFWMFPELGVESENVPEGKTEGLKQAEQAIEELDIGH